MLISIILPSTVKATGETNENWTDLTNAKIEIIGSPSNQNQSIEEATIIKYTIKISNVTLNPTSEYLVYFHYKDEEIKESQVLYHNQARIKAGENEAQITNVKIADFLQKSGDIYVSILEKQGSDVDAPKKLILTTRKVERPELLPKLGNRFNIYFTEQSTKTYFWAPNVNPKNGSSIDRTLKIKVGQVTDSKILKTMKENKQEGYKQLLNYAKKANNHNYVGTIEYKLSSNAGITESLTSKMNLIDGAYYFAYIELDNENGVYYPVEDISLYYAKGTKELVRYPKKEFVWNIKEEVTDGDDKKDETPNPEQPTNQVQNTVGEPTNNLTQQPTNVQDNTQAPGTLPQTGGTIIYLVVIITLITLVGIVYRKYNQYKDI